MAQHTIINCLCCRKRML